MDLATIQIKVDTRQVNAANDDIKRLGKTGQTTSKQVNSANEDMAKSAKSTTSAFKLLGGAMAALGVGALVTSFARTVTESERLKGSLKTMTGSTENAAFAFQELEKFASQTPFTLDQSVEGFIKLKALGLDPSERALRSYGNTSAAMGKDMMQMIEAVADASTGEFERLKEFGIKASSEGDRVSLTFQGMTTTIGKNSEEIQEYLLGIGETKFGSAMEDQMKAIPGLLSNLEDSVGALFRKIGDVGGIELFAGAISGASAIVVGITNNIDTLAIGLGAVTAGFLAFSAGSIAASIVSGLTRIKTVVLALNKAVRANPIGFVAAALATAAVAMIANFDAIKSAAEKAGINIEIAFHKVKIFLMEGFVSALDAVARGFTKMKNDAIATMAAVKAAILNPTDAINTFNKTFDATVKNLGVGRTKTDLFSASITASQSRVGQLNRKLSVLNTEVVESDENFVKAEGSLSDFKGEIDEAAVAATELALQNEEARVATLELLGEISNEKDALSMTNAEIAIRNNLQKIGVEATSELGQQIVAATTELHKEKDAYDAAADAAKELEKTAKEVAEEKIKAFERTRDTISQFFVDTFENGKVNFEKIATSFKNMIIKMLADWAASKIAETMTNTFSGIGTSISGIFSNIASGVGGAVSSMASSAASAVGSFLGVTGGTAAGTAAGGAAGGAAGSAAGTAAGAAGGTAAGLTIGGTLASAGQFVGGMFGAGTGIAAGTVGPPTAAAAMGSKLGAALFNPVTAAIAAALAVGHLVDEGGTPTSAAGITMAKTAGMNQNGQNTFAIPEFESGFAPLGFKQNATDADAAKAIAPIRDLDAIMTTITKNAGFDVNLAGHTFSGVGVEGSGSGTLLGAFIEEGKEKGLSMEKQMDNYAKEWVHAVGARNGISSSFINEAIGGKGAEGILQEMGTILSAKNAPALETMSIDRSNAATQGLFDFMRMQDVKNINGSHANGLPSVPFDGYIAELHAGERVQTAEQVRNSDRMSEEMGGLRQSMEEVLIVVARNTGKLFRLNDRWDKNGLPPVRT